MTSCLFVNYWHNSVWYFISILSNTIINFLLFLSKSFRFISAATLAFGISQLICLERAEREEGVASHVG